MEHQVSFGEMLQILPAIFGEKWLEKGYEEITKTHSLYNKHGKFNSEFLYTNLHPVQEWYGAVTKEELDTGQIPANRAYRSLIKLAANLQVIQKCENWEMLIPRLKNIDEYYATEFEVDVAVSYANKGYSVEFINPHIEGKTADLKVSLPNNIEFYVECKRYEIMTNKKKKEHKLWSQLEQRIINYTKNNKKNFYIHIETLKNLTHEDLNLLFEFIFDRINLLDSEYPHSSPAYIFNIDHKGNQYHIYLAKLQQADHEIRANEFLIEGFATPSKVKLLAEIYRDKNGVMIYRNPLLLSYKNWQEENLPPRIRDQFKRAVKQLPHDSIGIIWIRIPDNSLIQEKFIEQHEAIYSLLKKKMSGKYNRRINYVIIQTYRYENKEENGISGLSAESVKMIVEHCNPRHKI